jgi:hypothetical protein
VSIADIAIAAAPPNAFYIEQDDIQKIRIFKYRVVFFPVSHDRAFIRKDF